MGLDRPSDLLYSGSSCGGRTMSRWLQVGAEELPSTKGPGDGTGLWLVLLPSMDGECGDQWCEEPDEPDTEPADETMSSDSTSISV